MLHHHKEKSEEQERKDKVSKHFFMKNKDYVFQKIVTDINRQTNMKMMISEIP